MTRLALALALLAAACGDDLGSAANPKELEQATCAELAADIAAVFEAMDCEPHSYSLSFVASFRIACEVMPEPPTAAEVAACHDELEDLEACRALPPPACLVWVARLPAPPPGPRCPRCP